MPNPTVPAAAPGLPAAQKPSRRAFLKAGTSAATAALAAVPVALLPREADAAVAGDTRIASLWAQWQVLKPEYEHLVAEDRAARDRYLAAQPALPREAYAGPQHFGFGVGFLDKTPSGQPMRWGMASHWRELASACEGIEYSHWVRHDALHRAAVMDRWGDECDALRDSSGVTSIGDRLAAIEDQLNALEEQILAEPIRTLDDVSMQAKIVREYLWPGGWQEVVAFINRLEQVGGLNG